MNDNEFGNLVL